MISQIMLEQSAMEDGVLTDEAKKQFVEYMAMGVEYNEKWVESRRGRRGMENGNDKVAVPAQVPFWVRLHLV